MTISPAWRIRVAPVRQRFDSAYNGRGNKKEKGMAMTEYKEFLKESERVDVIISQGHGRHCACRMIWGDGICTCNRKGTPLKETMEKIIDFVRRNP